MTNPNTDKPRFIWAPRLALIGLAGLGSALVGNGCSAVLNFNQCVEDADCGSFDGTWVCENNECVPGDGETTATETTGDGDGDMTGDGDGDMTGDGDGDTTGDGDGEPQGCTNHSDCWEDGNPQADVMCGCDNVCVQITTPNCVEPIWPSLDGEDNVPQDNVVFVGSIMPTSPPFDTLVLPIQKSMELALSDFNQTASLPGGKKIAWLPCDSLGGTAAIEEAEHLVNDMCVPAIVGPVFSEAAINVAETVTIPAGVFTISPTATNKALTNLDDNGLVWRPLTSDIHQAEALADRIDALIQPGENAVLLHKNDAYGNDLALDAYAVAESAASITSVIQYDLQNDPMEPIANLDQHIPNTAFTDGGMNPPEYIIMVGTSEVQAFIAGYLQTILPMALPPPRFVFSHGAVPSMVDIIKNPLVIDDDQLQMLLYATMEGVAPIIFDADNYATFNARYMFKFGETNTISTSSLAYDSALMVMFAMSAIPDGEPITGANIAAAMPSVVDGEAGTDISCGPEINLDFIDDAVNQLSVGNTIDLKCISGELNFNIETGEVRTDYLGWEVEAVNDNLDTPGLVTKRYYALDPVDPDGTWSDLP